MGQSLKSCLKDFLVCAGVRDNLESFLKILDDGSLMEGVFSAKIYDLGGKRSGGVVVSKEG